MAEIEGKIRARADKVDLQEEFELADDLDIRPLELDDEQ